MIQITILLKTVVGLKKDKNEELNDTTNLILNIFNILIKSCYRNTRY